MDTLPQENPLSKATILVSSVNYDVFVFVEGKTDQAFYLNRHKNKTRTNFIDSIGKKNVIAVSRNFQSRSDVIGVCDCDHDQVLNQKLQLTNLYYSDNNDLEMDSLKFGDFSKFGELLLSETKKKRLGGRPLSDAALNASIPLGALRLLCRRGGHDLRFLGFKPSRKHLDTNYAPLISKIASEIAEQNVAKDILKPFPTKKERRDFLVGEINKILAEGHNPFDLVRGHDFCGFYSAMFNDLKKTSANNLKESHINYKLLDAYNFAQYISTQIGSNLNRLTV